MWWWFALIWLYVIGCIGFNATARDYLEPPHTAKGWRALMLWPVLIMFYFAVELHNVAFGARE